MKKLQVGWIVLGEDTHPPYKDQWGLIKSEEDLEDEYEKIKGSVKNELRGDEFSFFGGDLIKKPEEILDISSKYQEADVLLVFGVSGAGRFCLKRLMGYDIPVILFTKVTDEKIYGHALYQQWFHGDALENFGDVDLVINDYEE